jgi:geranylgeranyl reductase family protein
MIMCDVLIIGGGPAGSSCAARLSQLGMDVIVLDKQHFPREKPCGGWITPQVVDMLGLEVEAYGRAHVCQPLTGFRCGMIGRELVSVEYDHTISYGIRRYEFDEYLLSRCGARLFLGNAVRTIARSNGFWQVNEQFVAPMLVGAGGHFCPVARLVGARQHPRTSIVTAQEVEFFVSDHDLAQGTIDARLPELFFCRDLLGYGWCFRKGNYLNIGLGRLDNRHLSTHVAELCRLLQTTGKVVCQVPSHFRGHAYQVYERAVPTIYDEGVLLIGDAAGLAYPQSGEGIRPAIESGLLAAEVIRASRRRYGRGQLVNYENQIRGTFGLPRRTTAADWIPARILHMLVPHLLATPWFVRRVVMERWFLHSSHKQRSRVHP